MEYIIKLKSVLPLILFYVVFTGCPVEDELELVWSDEFNYSGLPDPTKWSYDVGDGCDLPCGCGWGNQEHQYYTEGVLENARVTQGNLIIEAIKEKKANSNYTSARLISKGKGDWKYGRIEIRAKLPSGTGTWPAIWMLSTEDRYRGWPRSGEIDIMEHVGYDPDTIFGTVHTEAFNGMIGTQVGGNIYNPNVEKEFHTYSIDWTDKEIVWYLDGEAFFRFENDGKGIASWPFDQKFYLVMNLAVGGYWGGRKGIDKSVFPQRLEIDYVRVYNLKKI